MAKRHNSLVVLSRDHHHGLAIAIRLRQGDKALLNDGWTHDRNEQSRRVQEFYASDLVPHFRAEEDALFPLMIKHLPQSTPLIDSLVKDHRLLEALVAQLRDSPAPGDLLEEIGRVLELHIRREERELFPMFEHGISGDIARGAGDEILRTHRASTRTS